LKCDKNIPCSTCVKKGFSNSCVEYPYRKRKRLISSNDSVTSTRQPAAPVEPKVEHQVVQQQSVTPPASSCLTNETTQYIGESIFDDTFASFVPEIFDFEEVIQADSIPNEVSLPLSIAPDLSGLFPCLPLPSESEVPLFDNPEEPMAITRHSRVIIDCNDKFAQALRYANRDDLLGGGNQVILDELFHPRVAHRVKAVFDDMIRSNKTSVTRPFACMCKDGGIATGTMHVTITMNLAVVQIKEVHKEVPVMMKIALGFPVGL
jgi:PAS domain-containing protein